MTSKLEIRVRWVLLVVVGVANVIGSLVVLLFATFVVPDPPLDDRDYVHMVNAVAFFSYPVVAARWRCSWGCGYGGPSSCSSGMVESLIGSSGGPSCWGRSG